MAGAEHNRTKPLPTRSAGSRAFVRVSAPIRRWEHARSSLWHKCLGTNARASVARQDLSRRGSFVDNL
jgi:hypothetical protein